MQTIAVKRLPHNLDLELPKYETAGAAAMDLRAAVQVSLTIEPGERRAIPTGFVGMVCSRSGMGAKSGVIALVAPGLVDSDYRGEVVVWLYNTSKREPFVVSRGDRIAQLMISPTFQPAWHEVEELSETERGAGGFGFTGKA